MAEEVEDVKGETKAEKKKRQKAFDNLDPADFDDLPSDLLSEDDKVELFQWMMGQSVETPVAVQKIATNLATKINIMMGYIITRNLSRIDSLINFMEDSEDYLFDAEELINMDDREDMLEYYKAAGGQMKDMLEWTRKYVYQNKQDLKEAGQTVDKLKSLLMALPQDVLTDLIEHLEKGKIRDLVQGECDTKANKADPDVPDKDIK
jgi:thymidylate synthase